MTVLSGLDAAGRRRSPATMPGYHAGRPPRNKGMRYPADPPTIDEIVAVMRHTSDDRHGWRVRAMIVVLWRAGLRIQEALALAEHDLDHRSGSILIRNGSGLGLDPPASQNALETALGLGDALLPQDRLADARLTREHQRCRTALDRRKERPDRTERLVSPDDGRLGHALATILTWPERERQA
jgi:integrase